MKKNISSIKVAIGVAIFTLAIMVFQFIYLGVILKKQAEIHSQEIALQTSQRIATSVDLYFREAYTVTQTYSQNMLVYRQEKLPRYTVYKLMFNSLSLSKSILDIWTMWEPNTYDNNDAYYRNDGLHDSLGHFAIAYYYDGLEIKTEINDPSDFNEDYYAIPKKIKQPIILDPYYYQYHGNPKTYFIASVTIPIIENNNYLGAIGVDLDLFELQSILSKITVYEDGFVCLLSNSGVIVSHKIPQYIEKNISEFTSLDNFSVTDLLKVGKVFTSDSFSEFSHENVVRYYYPISIKNMPNPWYVMIEIPKHKILEQANSLKVISTILLIASLILLSYLFYNITDRNRKAKELIKAKELAEQNIANVRAIIENTLDNIWAFDTYYNILYVNQRFQQEFQNTFGTFLKPGVNLLTALPEPLRPIWETRYKRVLNNEQFTLEDAIETEFGTIYIQVSMNPIEKDGQVIGGSCFGSNITPRRLAELELVRAKEQAETSEKKLQVMYSDIQASEEEARAANEELQATTDALIENNDELAKANEKFRLLAENLPGVIYLCKNDENWSMQYLTDEVEKLTGYNKEEFLNHRINFSDLYHPEDRNYVSQLVKKLDHKNTFQIQYRIKHKNGSWRWFDEIGMGIEINGGIELIEGFITDITEKKENEKELENYRKNLEELVKLRTEELDSINEELNASNEELYEQHEELQASMSKLHEAQNQLIQAEKMASLGILTAGVAHEINNPLNFIYNGTAAIESYIKDKYATDADYLNPMFEAVNMGVERVTGIIKSMGRYSRSENLPNTNCNIQEVIDDCLIILHNKYKNHIVVQKNYLPQSPIVFANEGQLHQAFLNILANAIQAIEHEGTITIDVNMNGINISDTGKGISNEHLKHIFDPFFTTKNPGEGTGLGLAITKKIIDELKGNISCITKINKGAIFKIELPLKKDID